MCLNFQSAQISLEVCKMLFGCQSAWFQMRRLVTRRLIQIQAVYIRHFGCEWRAIGLRRINHTYSHIFTVAAGNQISKSVYGANLEYINLDWSGVFNVHVNATVSYSLDVGSKKGCDDVISNLVTSGTSHSFKNPGSTLLSTIVQELHVVLTATYDTGKFTSYRATQKLSV